MLGFHPLGGAPLGGLQTPPVVVVEPPVEEDGNFTGAGMPVEGRRRQRAQDPRWKQEDGVQRQARRAPRPYEPSPEELELERALARERDDEIVLLLTS